MNKDIIFHKVEDVAIAIVAETNEPGAEIWNAYLLNLKKDPIETVLVSTKGYGTIEERKVKTSMLRHLLGNIEGGGFKLIEPIDKKLFSISNEFLVSFWYKGAMYDKKYVFVTESIIQSNFINIPLINKKGVMIK